MNAENTIELNPRCSQRLADALLRRRVELGYRSARAFSAAAGLDARTITALESGRRTNVSRNTLAILENALKWDPGYINALISMEPAGSDDGKLYLSGSDTSNEDVQIALQVAQAAFDSTLKSLQADRHA